MDYYANPWVQIVHASLSIPRYAADLKALARDLGISEKHVFDAVRVLVQKNIVQEKKGRSIKVVVTQLHLPKQSLLFNTWKTQLRLLALQKQQSAGNPADYSFSVVFSADENTRRRLQSEFLNFLKKSETQVKEAPEMDVFYMGFDLLQWTTSP